MLYQKNEMDYSPRTTNKNSHLNYSNFHRISNIEIEECIEAIDILNGQFLYDKLYEKLKINDIEYFICNIIAPLTKRVGEAWESGRINIFSEQLYTEVVFRILRMLIAKNKQKISPTHPKVLLTNLSKERHFIGLKMVEALLTNEGCQCVIFKKEISTIDIIEKIKKENFDILAMSFTDIHTPSYIESNLKFIRDFAPIKLEIWVGGECRLLYQKTINGIKAENDLKNIPLMVKNWRENQMTIN